MPAGRVMVMDPIYITGDPGGSVAPDSGGSVSPADLLDYATSDPWATDPGTWVPPGAVQEPSKLPVVLGVAGAGLLLWLFWPKSKPAMAGYRRRRR